jgi:hypothetical protein
MALPLRHEEKPALLRLRPRSPIRSLSYIPHVGLSEPISQGPHSVRPSELFVVHLPFLAPGALLFFLSDPEILHMSSGESKSCH